MEKIQAFMKLSFSTKVIVPVVGIMVLLLMMTVWLVNRRLTQQFQSEAVISLATANLRLEKSQEIRRNELLLRYRNLPREPRYKATFQAEDRKTVKDQLADL